jgi:hypothetical protein
MISLKARFSLFLTYLSLSNEGRHFLYSLKINSSQIDKGLRKKILSSPLRLHKSLNNLKICDQIFNRQVPGYLSNALGRARFEIYCRFVSYSWFMLETWTRLLDAFEIPYSRDALERCVIAAFVHREWNDLFDIKKYSFDELFKAIASNEDIPEQLTLLRQLKMTEDKLAPRDKFGNYYEHMKGFYKCSSFEYTKEKAEVVLDEVAPYVALVFMYIMVSDVPQALKDVLKPLSRWIYMLDELADLEADKKAGRLTYVGMALDPQAAVWQQYKLCEEALLSKAVKPNELIEFMSELSEKVMDMSRHRINIEESFLNIR